MESSDNRQALVRAARSLFAKRGYAAVSVDEIAEAAGLTKGSVYHQFSDKKDVFRAACEAVLGDIVARLAGGVLDQEHHSIDEIVTGADVLFGAYESDEARQMLLIDGPAVLGLAEWTAMQQGLRTELADHALEHLVDAGLIPRRVAPMLSHLLFGAFIQGVLQIASAKDRPAAAKSARAAYRRLAQGLLAARQ